LIFIDSWIWLEYFQDDDKSKEAEKVLEKISQDGGLICTTVLMEVRYQVRKKYDEQTADKITAYISSFENLRIIPLTEEIALRAADIREKYYHRNENPISYADSVHIAAAELTDCEKLYSGDPDFKNITEIKSEII